MTASIRLLFSSLLFLALFLPLSLQAQEENEGVELNIFPNPNRGTFYITVIDDRSFQSQLYAMDGRLVKTQNLQSGLNYFSIQAPAGIYILKVGNKEQEQDFRIVIK